MWTTRMKWFVVLIHASDVLLKIFDETILNNCFYVVFLNFYLVNKSNK
jgi:hypothetical protein